MPARDTSMTLEEFRKFYDRYRGSVKSMKAYDASGRRWVEGKEIFQTPGAYTMIVLQYKDRSFLRINVKPSIDIAIAREKYASASTWSQLGVYLTYEEKEFLESIGNETLTPEQLVEKVSASSFPGRERLARRLKVATEQMRR